MIEFIGILLTISIFTNGILVVVLDNLKKDNFCTAKENNMLAEEVRQLRENNVKLFEELKSINEISEEQKAKLKEIVEKIDLHEFPVDAKVSWIDKSGEVEYGIVVDDSKIDGKTFVHLRRLNKRGKIVGGVITVNANKIKLEN